LGRQAQDKVNSRIGSGEASVMSEKLRVTVSGLVLDSRYTCGILDQEGPGASVSFELPFIGWTTEIRNWLDGSGQHETEIVPIFLLGERDVCTVWDLNKDIPDNHIIVLAGLVNHKEGSLCQADENGDEIVKS
jgi:hypothetical protein